MQLSFSRNARYIYLPGCGNVKYRSLFSSLPFPYPLLSHLFSNHYVGWESDVCQAQATMVTEVVGSQVLSAVVSWLRS